MEKLISIIVPIYKVENYLIRCIESIVCQTYENIEIILVDDGSPDKCPMICDEWAKKDGRIKVIHKKNGGLSDARNAGITIAQGEFLLFVDSDDCIEKDLCESCMNVMDEDVDIVAFNYRRVYDTYSENKKECGVFEKFSNLEGFKRYINRTPFTHMAWDKLYRKCVFEDVRYPVDRLAEDMATTYKTFKNANKVGYLDRVLYNYFIRSDSIMGGKSLKLLLDAYQGEVEAYKYGNKYYPTLLVQNNTRFLNQSMKTYLKLIKNFSNNNEGIEDERKSVLINIQEIDKRHMPFKTMLFYCCFRFNKDFAWMVFKKFHLS